MITVGFPSYVTKNHRDHEIQHIPAAVIPLCTVHNTLHDPPDVSIELT
jgi:hypothetical protein